MNYQEAIDFLYNRLPMFQRIGAAAYKGSLENTIALSKITGEPEKTLLCIHVAGTNGKGSVSHLLASILQSAGYRVGLYTSPHLKDFRERIRLNGKVIPKSFVSCFVSKHKNIIQSQNISFFELTFAMAMCYFAGRQTDVAVIEAGMGGRLDSTNIIRPVLSIITNIGWDHMTFLGNSLEKIAAEKAGIMKKHIPVIIGEHQRATDDVFIDHARQTGNRLYFAEDTFQVASFRKSMKGHPCLEMDIIKDNRLYLSRLKTPLGGLYQLKNTITVMKAVEILKKSGYSILREHICTGFRNVIKYTGLMGRWQMVGHDPMVICDTGHNPDAFKEIARHLRFMDFGKIHMVFGLVSDKETASILELLPRDATYYFCRPDVPRGMDVAVLAKSAAEAGLNGMACDSVTAALQAAKAAATPGDLIFVGGSTFVVAEVI